MTARLTGTFNKRYLKSQRRETNEKSSKCFKHDFAITTINYNNNAIRIDIFIVS